MLVSVLLLMMQTNFVISDPEFSEGYFSRLSNFDNLIPVTPSAITLYNVSTIQCAGVCNFNSFCWVYFHNKQSYACKLYDVLHFDVINFVPEEFSASFQRVCAIDGFTSYYGMCVRASESNNLKTYDEAKLECEMYKSTLLILDTIVKYDLLLQYLTYEGLSDEPYIIGLTDRVTEGVWLWDNSNPVNMSIFAANQPNDNDGSTGYGGLGADCGTISLRRNGVGDKHCDNQRQFICGYFYEN